MSAQRFVLSLGVLIIFCQMSHAEDFGDPSPNVPELSELKRFEGKWEGVLGNSDLTIPSERRWTLHGYFLKHDFETTGGLLHGVIYRGYDVKNERFTMTFLDSQGGSSLLVGHWNSDLKTFQFEAIDHTCRVQRYESYFPDERTEQWTIVFDSEKMTMITGVAKREE